MPKPGKFDLQGMLKELAVGIERPRFGSAYAIASIIVLGLMILLPLIYLAMIGGVGYGVYYHLVNHVDMLQTKVRGRGYAFVAGAYVAPAFVGILMIAFMLKPFFARPAKQRKGFRHDPRRDPTLEVFITRICDAVGAPRPSVVEFTMDVNAAAGPRKGLISLVRRDLKLIIGIPLVAGLTIRQLGGVLAHEFGHFSQSTGMLLSGLIFRINRWFARVVFERDEWDEWLKTTASEVDIRIGWVLYLAQLGVWISRKVLHGLMFVGFAMSGRLSQQMEFDADRYEARLAGSEEFAETQLRLPVLGYGHQLAAQTVGAQLDRKEVVDDFPRLIAKQAEHLPREIVDRIRRMELEQQGSWFSTHPTAQERIDNAAREATPGILTADVPAAVLFANFEQLCRDFTRHFFEREVKLKLSQFALVSADDSFREEKIEEERRDAAVAYSTTPFPLSRTIPLREDILQPAESLEEPRNELILLREEILENRPQTLQRYDAFSAAQNEWGRGLHAMALHQCRIASRKDMPQEFRSLEATSEFLRDAEVQLEAAGDALAGYESRLGQRISWGVRAWLAGAPPDARRERLPEWIRSLRLYSMSQGAKRRLQATLVKLEFALEKFGQNTEDERIVRGIETLRREVTDEAQGLYAGLKAIPHPTVRPDARENVAESFIDDIPAILDAQMACRFGQALIGHMNGLHSETWLAVLTMASDGETLLGLAPLPAVEKQSDEDSENEDED